MASEKPQPIGFKTYLKLTLPFEVGGFLLGAWICRSPESLASFHTMLRSRKIMTVSEPTSAAEFNESWWTLVIVGTVLGMLIGEAVRPFIRKGPIFLIAWTVITALATVGCNAPIAQNTAADELPRVEGTWEQIPKELALAAGCKDHRQFIDPASGSIMLDARGTTPVHIVVAAGDVSITTQFGQKSFHRAAYEADQNTGKVNLPGDWRYSILARRGNASPVVDGMDGRLTRYFGFEEQDYKMLVGLNADGQYAAFTFAPTDRWITEMVNLRTAEGKDGPNKGVELVVDLPIVIYCRRTR